MRWPISEPTLRSLERTQGARRGFVQQLWLGHEQERTTHIYLHADLELKQRTLDRMTPPEGHPGRYRAPDTLLAFLESL